MQEHIDVKFIETYEIKSILPLVQVLNPNTAMHELEARLEDMLLRNYKCIGLFLNGQLVGICGIWLLNKFYVGKHMEIDNVVVDKRHQGKSYGKSLIQFALDFGKRENCLFCELNCYINNTDGILFWETLGFKKLGFHMQKTI